MCMCVCVCVCVCLSVFPSPDSSGCVRYSVGLATKNPFTASTAVSVNKISNKKNQPTNLTVNLNIRERERGLANFSPVTLSPFSSAQR